MPRNSDPISLDDGSYDPDDYDERQRDAETEHDYPDPAKAKRKRPAKRTTIPAHAPKPRDRQPKKADGSTPIEREATGVAFIDVKFDGETYSIPADPSDWSVDALQAFEENKAVTAIRELIKPEQFRVLKSKKYTLGKFSELFDLLAQHGGFTDAGN